MGTFYACSLTKMKSVSDRVIAEREGRAPRRFSFSRFRNMLLIVAAGLLVGYQISNPNKRFIQGFVGLALLLFLWNYPALGAILLFMAVYPFPFGFSLGYSNAFVIYIIFIIVLTRVAAKIDTFHFDKKFSLQLVLIALSYITSFYNLDYSAGFFKPAVIRLSNLLAVILFFYLIVNFLDDEEKLKKAASAIMLSIVLVIAFTIFELIFPGRVIIPGWLYTHHKSALLMKGLRMGGPFRDYELLAEFFALNAPLIFLLAIRSTRMLTRMFYGSLLVVDIFMMFTTITRGAFISLSIGFVYLLLTCRRDLNILRLVFITASFVIIILVLETVVAQYTISGSLFERLGNITFEEGGLPTARALGWKQGITRGMWHPFLGNGLELDWAKEMEQRVYPHNGYLFLFDLTGLFGLLSFLYFLFRLLRTSFAGFGSSLVNSPFSHALMKILHVWLIMFIIDQMKIDYIRNDIYMYYIWLFFGMIAATGNVIRRENEQRAATGAA
jgi:hypothetical protein